MAGPDADKWQHSASVGMQAHLENGTWQLVQLPASHKAIGSKWVFKVKHNSDSSVECYKACLIAQAFVFVDDITLASKSKAKIQELKQSLSEHFNLQDLRPTTFQLGVEIIRDHPNCTLC
jgi:hypothetical protein